MQPSETSLMGMRHYEGVISIFSPEFTFSKMIIRNQAGATITRTRDQLLGAPVSIVGGKAVLLATAAVTNSNIHGIIVAIDNDNGVSGVVNTSDSTVNAVVLSKGPATYAESMLKTIDAVGAALNMANVKDSLLAANIRVITKPATETIQVT